MVASMAASISGAAAPPVVGLDLEAVVGPRVVAGRDDDAGPGVQLSGEEAADLGRDGLGRREGANVVRGKDLDAGAREVLGREASIVAHDHATLGGTGLLQVLGNAARAAADVVERVVLGDGGAPAVGSELDLRHGRLGLDCRLRPMLPGLMVASPVADRAIGAC